MSVPLPFHPPATPAASMSAFEVKAMREVNETSVMQGNVTGNAVVFGVPLAWVETNRVQSLGVAFFCCLTAVAISVFCIYQHLQHYSRPQLQRYIVRILAIVPVYALGSFLSLKFVNQAVYFDTIRDCYEAFVVYSFLVLVLSFAGGESVCVLKMQGEPEIKHAWPLNRCMSPSARDGRLLRTCKRWAIQFVIVKPVFAVLSLMMLACGSYHTVVYQLLLIVVYNISYSVALYGLWLFYLATKHTLKAFNPVLKFFAVKGLIFLTFWQGDVIDLLPGITNEQAFVWKEFVLCAEMVPFAVILYIAYSPSQFKKNLDRLPDSEVLKNMKEVLSVSDILSDIYHNFMPSYQDYMLQRADSNTSKHAKRVVNFNLDSDSPTPLAAPNPHVPRFVIDDEDDLDDLDTYASSSIESIDTVDLEAGNGNGNVASSSVSAVASSRSPDPCEEEVKSNEGTTESSHEPMAEPANTQHEHDARPSVKVSPASEDGSMPPFKSPMEHSELLNNMSPLPSSH